MASRYFRQFTKCAEPEVCFLDGYFALDASSNVLPKAPTQSVAPTGDGYHFSKLEGADNSLSQLSGSTNIVTPTTQYHTSTGVYTILLDDPYLYALGVTVTNCWPSTGSAADAIVWSVAAFNCTGGGLDLSGSTVPNGFQFGNDPATNHQTLVLHAINPSTGALTDPPANYGFCVQLCLKNTGTPN